MSNEIRLTGDSLKQRIDKLQQENSDLSEEDLARLCGYYTVEEDGRVYVSSTNLVDFYDKVLNLG